MGELGFRTDCKSILSQIKHQEKQLKLKRRWLMGLPESKSELQNLDEPSFFKNRALPESLLREDDLFYDTVRHYVEKAFGACSTESWNTVQQHMKVFDSSLIATILASSLDDLTNKGLFLLAVLLTGCSVRFDKTRSKMKKVIIEFLTKTFRKQVDNFHRMEILAQLPKLLSDPSTYQKKRGAFSTSISLYHHAAATKILEKLKYLPFEALIAMYRKLRGVQLGMPKLKPQKSGWNRDELIKQIRKTCKMMLSELRNRDVLPEPLAKAMAVAGLALKLIVGRPDLYVIEFYQFSPEIKALQGKIANAIVLLGTNKVRLPELKSLQVMLDPNADISDRSLRTAIKKMLLDLLFECNDIDKIPDQLQEILSMINRSSLCSYDTNPPEDEIEHEIECILIVSAQAKQILWDLLPDYCLDKDFDDAYMEDLEESDDEGDDGDGGGGGDDDDDDDDSFQQELSSSCTLDSVNHHIEGTGESMPHKPVEASVTCQKSNLVESARMNPVIPNGNASSSPFQDSRLNDTFSVNINHHQEEIMDSSTCTTNENVVHQKNVAASPHGKMTWNNQYLAIQDLCDDASVVAYNLIGQLLHEFAKLEGRDLDRSDDSYLTAEFSNQNRFEVETQKWSSFRNSVGGSVVIELVEELMPSISNSGKDKVKELLGLC